MVTFLLIDAAVLRFVLYIMTQFAGCLLVPGLLYLGRVLVYPSRENIVLCLLVESMT